MIPNAPLTLEGKHVSACQVILLMFTEAAARFPGASDGFTDARPKALSLIGRMRDREQTYLDVMAEAGARHSFELDAEDAETLVRLLGRAIRWVPEFDDIQTLTGYSLDEVMLFYIDLKLALGVFGVSDEDLWRSDLSSPFDSYQPLPRLNGSRD